MMFKFTPKEKISGLPAVSGVYTFKSKRGVLLYIGKAINIKERVKNHFQQPTFKDNIFIPETEKIGLMATGSEIEALILEAELIKKYQPKYNQQWKDSKNYFFVVITKEDYPRVFITHQLQTANYKVLTNVGPFVDGKALKQTLRILRKVFPYRTCKTLPKKKCLLYDLELCPAPCINKITKTEYAKNIKNLLKILQSKKPQVLHGLKKEMRLASQKQNYEKAKTIRDQIMALENVFSHSHILKQAENRGTPESAAINWEKTEQKIKELLGIKTKIKRMEGYDISNIQGQEATGSMVVFENGKPNKNEYRKFKIQISGKPNDTAMLKEIISRRLKHKEWPSPQIILIDGGKGQLNAVITALKSEIRISKSETNSWMQKSNTLQLSEREALQFKILNIKTISLAKRKNELFLENRQKPVLLKDLPRETANLILQIRDEAHRFAITYHKKLRSKYLLPK